MRNRKDGQPYYGPSGAPIWNSPAVDEKRGLVYFGTGEANSEPTPREHLSTPIIAIDLKDRQTEKWSLPGDRSRHLSSMAARRRTRRPAGRTVRPDTVYRDVDFGASLILGTQKNGKQLVYAGQKSGAVWAMDPDTGKVVWTTPIGTGSALGGVHWGIAYDNDIAVRAADRQRRRPDSRRTPPIDPSLESRACIRARRCDRQDQVDVLARSDAGRQWPTAA